MIYMKTLVVLHKLECEEKKSHPQNEESNLLFWKGH
jgi:hypothetical protein